MKKHYTIHDPEIIINNPTPKSEKDYIAGKKLNEKKMGEVGIRKDENISKIFHANEKRIKNLELENYHPINIKMKMEILEQC
ncbi:hypothetical protein MSV78_001577 [Campylobacter coli]|nr:hypothetical protein [Campylobacter coli]